MTSKTSLAALALLAALLAIPTGANAGFVGHDRYWTGVDARMQRLWSFKWLCRDEPVVAKESQGAQARACANEVTSTCGLASLRASQARGAGDTVRSRRPRAKAGAVGRAHICVRWC